ncbi:TPA: amino acid permease [Legionella pneumophila]|nr:amino acid permease [Legionella pneumophila]HAT8869397.1 amino acid permease [Legionella pneumophila subsp. pneumophila]HAT8642825.1 amino acid permease [Legionella pneumophila]HAT8890891.1 amino acid permease [Legionella pneumophila subsp. pneumophila]HAT8934487.1 amino acid permease [Legionella pneumophila subsp. pneumophila]
MIGNKTMDMDIKHKPLKRELSLFGATMMGLGSIVGTGVFVSIGIAAGVTGPSVILAIALAALVATCNAFSSAQLAANHAVSGGTYEYGYRYLHPAFGFTAGWMFLCAKSASAATAALGFAGYFIHLSGLETVPVIPIALAVSITLILLVLSGLRRTNTVNIIIVMITLITLTVFIISGLPEVMQRGTANLRPFFPVSKQGGLSHFFYATALMFVAYTGYGRIATLAEEVKNPGKFIPAAIIITLMVSAVLYILVGLVAIGAVGVEKLAQVTETNATPLESAAQAIGIPGLSVLVSIGACTAMLGVLLNLILGLSRVALAMGRKGDLPKIFCYVSEIRHVPVSAVIGVGVVIIALVLTGSVETTWTFSAFTVLIYYAITNLAALHLPKEEQLYPPLFAIGGLLSCLFLAFWVPTGVWITGISLLVLGLLWKVIANRFL